MPPKRRIAHGATVEEASASSDAIEHAYDRVPYFGSPNPTSHPDHLRTIATLFGLDAAPATTCRVLELGCGDGANLVPIAATFPGAAFIGCDVAAQPLMRAEMWASKLRLSNVRLLQRDLRLLNDIGTFDYVIAHGLYSWVPAEVRALLLPLIAQCLAPQGIAFVSYNAYPGCHVREAAWEMLRYHTRGAPDGRAKLTAARELIGLLGAPANICDPIDQAIPDEMRRLGERCDALLLHDDLALPNHPVYFHEFVADAKCSGLDFLAEADLGSRNDMDLMPHLRHALAGMGRLEREQYVDFVRVRRYRESLLCHAGVSRRPEIDCSRVDGMHAYASARLLAGVRVPDARNDEPGGALAEWLLARWPRSASMEEVREWHAHSASSSHPREESLEALIVRLFAAASINLRLHAPTLATTAGIMPEAFRPARSATHDHDVLPNVYHEGVRIDDPVARRLVQRLDGRHRRTELAAALGAPYAGEEGAAYLEKTLSGLASMAMLVG